MKKKLLSILIVLSLVLSCIACGGRSDDIDHGVYLDVDFGEEPTTITYLTIGDKPTTQRTKEVIDKLNEQLIKKVNCRIDIYYVGWNDYLDNYNRVLENGEVELDLIGTSTDWLDAWPNVFNGSFLPLSEEMMRTFCPKTYSNVSADAWRKCSYNGDIYLIPENEYSQWTNHGFIYRKDIAKEAEINEITSWNDLDRYLSYVTIHRPDLQGWYADTTNTVITLGYFQSKLQYVPIYEVTTYGLWGACKENMDEIFSPYYEGTELIDFARLMKRWNNAGVWDTTFPAGIDNLEEFYSGNTAVEQHHTQNYYTIIKPTMALKQPSIETGFFWFGEESGTLCKTSILHGATAVYAGSKNPEKALMVYDVIRNDPTCYKLMRYGIEGVQYEINNDGILEKPSGYNADRDSILTNYWWGRRDELEIPDSSYAWDEYYELIDEYEHVAIDYPWDGVAFATPQIRDDIVEILAICDKYIPEITYARYEKTPEEEVAEFREKLKEAGFEETTRKLKRILKNY